MPMIGGEFVLDVWLFRTSPTPCAGAPPPTMLPAGVAPSRDPRPFLYGRITGGQDVADAYQDTIVVTSISEPDMLTRPRVARALSTIIALVIRDG